MTSTQSSFASLGVPSDIVAALDRRAITQAFPIQSATVPDALAGRDVCGKAPTGSGKTLAFGIGAIGRLTGARSRPGRPRVLVLVPTRELASQVATELRMLAIPRNLRVDSFYGGVGYGPQLKALSRGVDVAVACPGRLEDLLERGSIRLDAVETVVVDEADRMADMGFLPQLRRILDRTPADRQTLLFSATLDGDVDVLVGRYQRHPSRHELETEGDGPGAAVHLFWKVASGDRIRTAAEVASTAGPTIVFCRTKHSTDRIARQLEGQGARAAAIHGDRSQKQREKALELFARGAVDVLVATDVAARGIHVDGVNAVVHFDPPSDAKDYQHRSGRTARAGATGVVVNLVTPDKAGAVRRIQRELGLPAGTTSPDMARISAVVGAPPERLQGDPGRTATRRSDRSSDRIRRSRRATRRWDAVPGAPRNGSTHPNGSDHPNGSTRSGPTEAEPAGSGGTSRTGPGRSPKARTDSDTGAGGPRHGRAGGPRHGRKRKFPAAGGSKGSKSTTSSNKRAKPLASAKPGRRAKPLASGKPGRRARPIASRSRRPARADNRGGAGRVR